MAYRNWLCTRNNPEKSTDEYLELFQKGTGAVYVVGQLEKGKEGTPHVQFYVNFKTQQRISRLTKFDPKGHYIGVNLDNGVAKYCMKEDTRVEGPFEFGVKPVERNSKTDWEEVKQAAA